MESRKSFYDFDYIIELGEKRVEQYIGGCQLILGRTTNIILIYSIMGIYLVPVIQDFTQFPSGFLRVNAAIFMTILIVSVFFAIRLLLPFDITYFQKSSIYYQDLRQKYEAKILKPAMTAEEITAAQALINNLLKASYIDELIRSQNNNAAILGQKTSYYYRALLWGLIAMAPYILCVGFHITRKVDSIQKVELVNVPKSVSLHHE